MSEHANKDPSAEYTNQNLYDDIEAAFDSSATEVVFEEARMAIAELTRRVDAREASRRKKAKG